MSEKLSDTVRKTRGYGDLKSSHVRDDEVLVTRNWMNGTADDIAALESEFALLRKAMAQLATIDGLTAEAIADLIDANRVPSPWRDGGLRLKQFGTWLRDIAAIAHDTLKQLRESEPK